MEGPRGLRPEEIGSLREMTGIVFRPSLVDDYPQLFNEDNYENLRVCVDDGRCVSHVGMIVRDAAFFGCPLRVCCIGAVSTHPDYRNRGLASACFDDAAEKAFRDGVDLMIVSGDRSLYRMRGCLHVGRDTAFTLTEEALPRIEQAARLSVTVEAIGEDRLTLLTDAYQREPVRFLRPRDDYERAMRCGIVMDRPSDFLVVRERGEACGYAILARPKGDRKTRLSEFAGDRRALLAALPEIFRRYGLAELGWQVQGHDHLFRNLCEGAGLLGTARSASGTVKLLHFRQLMERMRPRWEELLGRRDAAKLHFWQREGEYGFRFADDELVTDRDTATRLLFGTVEGGESRAVEGRGALTEVLRTILPLPGLWYGISHV